MITRTISINGMTQEDKERINEVLLDVWGIRDVSVHPEKGEAVVSFDEKAASFIDFEQAVRDSGYDVAVPDSKTEMEES
ncbi:heavy-metal-associated domain-containing protein [Alteribacillus sp. YIM 98480]|uniref:heavy-metal-associated domain-containing protein n=1 Tax=Alteribacillus sp. YIM 98480 TaxID=2606599 RepID=UPI00131E9D91|nr:cation transporter [Alteribacillus sp. YIM 98480]